MRRGSRRVGLRCASDDGRSRFGQPALRRDALFPRGLDVGACIVRERLKSVGRVPVRHLADAASSTSGRSRGIKCGAKPRRLGWLQATTDVRSSTVVAGRGCGWRGRLALHPSGRRFEPYRGHKPEQRIPDIGSTGRGGVSMSSAAPDRYGFGVTLHAPSAVICTRPAFVPSPGNITVPW